MSMTETEVCRWAGAGNPRLLKTHLNADCPSTCEGCKPCAAKHCALCGREHVTELTCASCVGEVRTNLTSIGKMTPRLLGEAVYRGVNSEAANLAGPVADPEAWTWRKTAARQGRADHVSLTEDDDSSHPLWVLGTWEMLIREHLKQPTTALVTIAASKEYLAGHLTTLAQDEDFAFEELARDVRKCFGHLEDVLSEGEREERGEKCPMCGTKRLVKDYGTKADAKVMWRCPNLVCQQSYTEDEYRDKVKNRYVKVAPELNLTDMALRLPLLASSTIRRWASRQATGEIRDGEKVYRDPALKACGRDESGRKLYRVADVEALWVAGGRMSA